ncbi:Uncharacterised protein [Vibrio cholerae]|nr:Uncharacterised protein [Vibrio cholerae]CSC01254.1 Uncharacterised protein [Vibrio cholerae]
MMRIYHYAPKRGMTVKSTRTTPSFQRRRKRRLMRCQGMK